MATSAQFTAQPIIDIAQVSTSNSNRDGTGTIVTVASGPSTTAGNGVGKRINRVVINAATTTTVGMIRFFLSLDSGTTNRLIGEVLVPAVTASSSNSAFRAEVGFLNGLVLPGGNTVQLRASTEVSNTFNIIVESGLL
jgi:hypothetical protein